MSPSGRMDALQHEEIPAAARRVRETHQAWLAAKALKAGLLDELRDLAGQLLADEVGS